MQESIESKLNEFAKLEKNWDSYNGDPPTERALEIAGITANLLKQFTVFPSQLVPTPDGGITLELHVSGAEFSITLDEKGCLTSVFISNADVGYIEFEVNLSETLDG